MSNFVGEGYMQNEYFYIKDLNEKLQIKNIPDELFSETFLLNYEKNQVFLSEGMADVFRNPDQPKKGRISLDQLLNYFTSASRSVFLHDLSLLKEKKKNKDRQPSGHYQRRMYRQYPDRDDASGSLWLYPGHWSSEF